MNSRWKCCQCGSHNVQVSYPTWYRESKDYSLEVVEPDQEAEVLWWWCEDCDGSDSGSPDRVE